MTEVTLNVAGLDKLMAALKGRPPTLRVGILGTKAERQGGGVSNAQIGAAHEFGTTELPQRSFLRIPIAEHLEERMEASGAIDQATLDKVIASGSVVPWLKKVGVLAEGIVSDAFDTGGFGRWVPSNMALKKVKMTLVETTQLRNSITSEVVE